MGAELKTARKPKIRERAGEEKEKVLPNYPLNKREITVYTEPANRGKQ